MRTNLRLVSKRDVSSPHPWSPLVCTDTRHSTFLGPLVGPRTDGAFLRTSSRRCFLGVKCSATYHVLTYLR